MRTIPYSRYVRCNPRTYSSVLAPDGCLQASVTCAAEPSDASTKQYKGLYNGWALSYFQALAHVQAPVYVSHRFHQRKWPLSSHRAQATLIISKGSVFYLQQFTPLRFYLVRSKTSAHVERACLPSAPSAGQGGRCDARERAQIQRERLLAFDTVLAVFQFLCALMLACSTY